MRIEANAGTKMLVRAFSTAFLGPFGSAPLSWIGCRWVLPVLLHKLGNQCCYGLFFLVRSARHSHWLSTLGLLDVFLGAHTAIRLKRHRCDALVPFPSASKVLHARVGSSSDSNASNRFFLYSRGFGTHIHCGGKLGLGHIHCGLVFHSRLLG